MTHKKLPMVFRQLGRYLCTRRSTSTRRLEGVSIFCLLATLVASFEQAML